MTYRCDHLHLRSLDAVAAAGFYVESLGAREIRREGAPVSRVVIDLGGLTLFIEQAPVGTAPTAQPPHLGMEHIGLAVDDLDKAIADLRRRNVALVTDVMIVRPGLRIAFIEGPDHLRIELLERKPTT